MPTTKTTKTTTTQQIVTQPITTTTTTKHNFALTETTNQEYLSQPNLQNTKYFISTVYLNNIYECNITIEKIWSDNGINTPSTRNYDRIYAIRFFRATKANIESNEKVCWVMAVTRNRLYQFISPGLISSKQIFRQYEPTPALFNDSCKTFSQNLRGKGDF